MSTPLRILIGSSITLVALATFGALFAPAQINALTDSLLHPTPAVSRALMADPTCSPATQGCVIKSEALSMTLQFGGLVKPLTPFPVILKLTGPNAHIVSKVTLDFSMPGMDMGINRFDLRRRQDGVWEGQVRLPACNMGHTDWQVEVQTAGYGDTATQAGLFQFNVQPTGAQATPSTPAQSSVQQHPHTNHQ